MKKVYVKPVFFAEEFVAETSYANSPCGQSIWVALQIKDGDCFCEKDGILAGGKGCGSNTFSTSDKNAPINSAYTGTWPSNVGDSFTYWNYANYGDNAAYLFGSSMQQCDFVWSGNKSDSVYVWNSAEKDVRGDESNILDKALGVVSYFFANNQSSGGNHPVGYEGTSFRS